MEHSPDSFFLSTSMSYICRHCQRTGADSARIWWTRSEGSEAGESTPPPYANDPHTKVPLLRALLRPRKEQALGHFGTINPHGLRSTFGHTQMYLLCGLHHYNRLVESTCQEQQPIKECNICERSFDWWPQNESSALLSSIQVAKVGTDCCMACQPWIACQPCSTESG